MKNIPRILQFALAVLLTISCTSKTTDFKGGGSAGKDLEMKMAQPEASSEPQPVADDALALQTPATSSLETLVVRKIIKDGRIEIRVKELEQGKKDIDSLVKKYRCYYADETLNNTDFAHGYTLKIRIPSVNFEAFITEIETGIGELVYKNITSRDVTEEFIDLESRLKNKLNYLNQYRELLKQAKSVKDILEIEEKTRLIEEEVESVQGRLKYLNNQIDYSTLDVQITKKNDYNIYSDNKGNFVDRLKLSLVKGWFGLINFILFVIRIWPFWIIVGLLYYLFRIFIRTRKKINK